MYIKRLKDLREIKNLTQEELCQKINCKQQAYSLYENGKRALPYELLINLANYYKTSTDYILGLTNIKVPYPKNKPQK